MIRKDQLIVFFSGKTNLFFNSFERNNVGIQQNWVKLSVVQSNDTNQGSSVLSFLLFSLYL